MLSRTRLILSAAVLATVMATAGAAGAQQPGPRSEPGAGPGFDRQAAGRFGGPRRGLAREIGGGQMLRAADANQDGAASREEVAALTDESFAYRDRNGDGVLDREDLGPIARRLADRIAERRADRADDPWARPRPDGRVDADDDGRITREELTARIDMAFARLDADGDGLITAEEARSAAVERPRGPRRGL